MHSTSDATPALAHGTVVRDVGNVWTQPDAGTESIAHALAHHRTHSVAHALSHSIADAEVRWSIRCHASV